MPLWLDAQGSFARTVHEEWCGLVGVIPAPINKGIADWSAESVTTCTVATADTSGLLLARSAFS